jgi:hypothetical protein
MYHLTVSQKIKNAAITLVSESGFEVVSLEQIAKKAGVSRNMLNSHFRDKEELLSLCCLLCVNRLVRVAFLPSINFVPLHRGIKEMWFNYIRFQQEYYQEAIFLQQFFKSPSCISSGNLKQEIIGVLNPFIGYLIKYDDSTARVKGIIILSFLINSTRSLRKRSTHEISLRADTVQMQFGQHFWPEFERIMKLPITA